MCETTRRVSLTITVFTQQYFSGPRKAVEAGDYDV